MREVKSGEGGRDVLQMLMQQKGRNVLQSYQQSKKNKNLAGVFSIYILVRLIIK